MDNLLRQVHGIAQGVLSWPVDMMDAKDHGLDNAAQRTPATSSPTGFRQWCAEVLKPALSRPADRRG